MSTYEYILEVSDKASGFINQFTKTLDRVNERFGSNRISGTQAFESLSGPLSAINSMVDGLGNQLSTAFDLGTEGEMVGITTEKLGQGLGALAIPADTLGVKLNNMFGFTAEGNEANTTTNLLQQGLGLLEAKAGSAFGKMDMFAQSLSRNDQEGEKTESTFSRVSTELTKLAVDTGNSGKMLDNLEARIMNSKDTITSFADSLASKAPAALAAIGSSVDMARDKFLEIGATVGSMPLGEAVSTVMSGVGESIKGVLPNTMNEEWMKVSEGIQTNLVPALNSFSEMTGISLDSISPRIAEMATSFGNFFTSNGPAIQEFISSGSSMLEFVSSTRDTITQLNGKWGMYKGLLTKTNILAKISSIRTAGQALATKAFALASGKLTIATKLMAAGQRILNMVLASNPLIFILTLLLAGAAAIMSFARKSDKASEATKKFNEANERTNDLLEKGEELRKRVNSVDNLSQEGKDKLKSDLQERQKAMDEMYASNKKQIEAFGLDEKKAMVADGTISGDELKVAKQEIEKAEELQKTNQRLANNMKDNSNMMRQVNTSMGVDAEDGIEPSMAEMQQGTTEIAGGGKKSTNINISLEKMIETLEVHATSLDDGFDEVESRVKEVFLRVLNSGNYAAQ
ncbi:MAG: hypothetical protein Roseis2KO_27560 [Roseivirga sp.]